jgi:hypothetical protein
MHNQTYPKRIGNDRILRKGDRLIVCSTVDMREWQVQQIRKTGILIDDEIWQLSEKRHTSKKQVRYFLDSWPEFEKEIPGRMLRYDEEYVRARDKAEKKRKIEAFVGPMLALFKTLIGFLPSRLKSRLEEKYGVSARNATYISIMCELVAFYVAGAFLLIFTFGSMIAPQLARYIPFFIVLVLVMLADVAMRYDSYLREDLSPWGLFEWIIPRRKKRH